MFLVVSPDGSIIFKLVLIFKGIGKGMTPREFKEELGAYHPNIKVLWNPKAH